MTTHAFLCAGVRTPFGRYGGALAQMRADDLGAWPIRAFVAAHPQVDPAAIDEDDAEHVNPNGGAIAIGHPLGASGARIALTAALELERRAARRAIATMCIGVGQGIAVLIERVR